MKKILSMAMLAVVALVACTLVSCSSDDGGSDSGSKSQQCSFTAYLTSDILKIYDVSIVRTSGKESKKYTFTTDVTFDVALDSHKGKSNGGDNFSVKKGDKASVSASLSLKTNWQDIVNSISGDEIELAFYKKVITETGASGTGSDYSIDKAKATKEALESFAEKIASFFTEEIVK